MSFPTDYCSYTPLKIQLGYSLGTQSHPKLRAHLFINFPIVLLTMLDLSVKSLAIPCGLLQIHIFTHVSFQIKLILKMLFKYSTDCDLNLTLNQTWSAGWNLNNYLAPKNGFTLLNSSVITKLMLASTHLLQSQTSSWHIQLHVTNWLLPSDIEKCDISIPSTMICMEKRSLCLLFNYEYNIYVTY